jgi:hypothetical protein
VPTLTRIGGRHPAAGAHSIGPSIHGAIALGRRAAEDDEASRIRLGRPRPAVMFDL